MRVQSPSDFICYVITRLPMLALLAGIIWVAVAGLHQLESWSYGTEFTIGNHETANVMPTVGAEQTQRVEAAMASGDVAQMEQALAELQGE